MISASIKKLISAARAKGASDIHICANAPILFRIGRDLLPSTTGRITPEISERMAAEMLEPKQMERFRERGDYDMMIADDDGRYRVNLSYNDRSIGFVIRILPERVKSLDELKLPPVVKHLASVTKGLVLITGSTSQGKTATMSAIINEVNTTQRRHIITIEDPIENVHANKMGVVRQREVGSDTETFYTGLRAALRQDPDVVAIGEMRDYETIRIGLIAAETGMLVLSTLHIISIDKLLERVLSYSPSEEQTHLRYLLAGALQGIIHQELLPTVDGGKRVACEVLLANDGVKNVIRHRDSFFLRNIIQTGQKAGMVTMRQSVTELLEQGVISAEVAESVLLNY